MVGAALVLAACGASDSTESQPAATEAPAAAPAGQTAPEPTEAPTTEAPATDAPAEPADAPADESAAEESAPAPEPEPAPDPAGPEPAPIGGREFGADLMAASAFEANPLPDLLVDDVRRGNQVNLANALPSARPLLIWAWAPH